MYQRMQDRLICQSQIVSGTEAILNTSDNNTNVTSSARDDNLGYITMDELNVVQASSKPKMRHSKLTSLFQPLINMGAESMFNYKFIYANSVKFVNTVSYKLRNAEDMDDVDIASGSVALTPRNKNDRYTDTTNHANRGKRNGSRMSLPKGKIQKKKEKTSCEACLFYNGSEEIGHRQYSLNCPQRGNPNHIRNKAGALYAKALMQEKSTAALEGFTNI